MWPQVRPNPPHERLFMAGIVRSGEKSAMGPIMGHVLTVSGASAVLGTWKRDLGPGNT